MDRVESAAVKCVVPIVTNAELAPWRTSTPISHLPRSKDRQGSRQSESDRMAVITTLSKIHEIHADHSVPASGVVSTHATSGTLHAGRQSVWLLRASLGLPTDCVNLRLPVALSSLQRLSAQSGIRVSCDKRDGVRTANFGRALRRVSSLQAAAGSAHRPVTECQARLARLGPEHDA